MADYIKREDVLNGLDKLCDIVCPYSKKQRSVMCGACTLGSAFDAIEEMTAADVVERKTGKWIGVSENDTYPRCSNCNRTRLGSSLSFCKKHVPFCEWCGAEMENMDDV